jgi:hypothetical protein
VKFTLYFQAVRQRADRKSIKDEWIQYVLEHPVKEVVQRDGRLRRWAPIPAMSGKYLQVVVLSDGERCITPFLTGALSYED